MAWSVLCASSSDFFVRVNENVNVHVNAHMINVQMYCGGQCSRVTHV